MASRKLSDLHPDLQPLCEKFLDLADAQGIEVLITCTWRSGIEQASLYAQGRITKGRIVTNAKPGESKHNNLLNGNPASLAFDIVPMVNGKPMWDGEHPGWKQLGEIGRSLGLEWAGDWRGFKELPQCQLKLVEPTS